MVIGFIGAGKMARALARGLANGGIATGGEIICTSRSRASAQPFLDLFPNSVWTDKIPVLAQSSGLIVLAIKPQQFEEVLPSLRLTTGKLFLSLAAGITLARMQTLLGPEARLVRVMPNTPMQIGAGASVYASGSNVTDADLELVHRILSSAGKAWRVDEASIDAVTALSGSGPAYVFHFIEALARAGAKLGLDEKLARELAIQTVTGSAQLAAQSNLSPLELAAQVKSPGGTTLAGCAVLEENDALHDLLARTLAAAKARAEALARGEP